MPFKNYGIKDGLTNNNVQAVIRDSRGLLWVGTDFGVNWFDGKRFYQPELKTNIGQLYVSGFYEDRNGVIWVLTFFNGIYKYQNGRFSNYLVDTLLKDANTNSVSDMLQVSADKYVVINQNCAYLFDGKGFSSFDPENEVLRTKTNAVTQLPDGMILFSTDKGVFLYRYKNGRFAAEGLALKNQPTNKILAAKDKLWVLRPGGLLSFKNTKGPLFSGTMVTYFDKKTLKDVTIDRSGTVWAIADNGSFWALADTVFKIKNGKITPYSNRNGLPENIQQIYCDNEGLVWFANRKGVGMLGDEYYEFNNIISGGLNIPVSSLIIDGQNNLLVGTITGLMLKKDNRYIFPPSGLNQQIGYVSWIKKNKSGNILAGTGAGVLQITGSSIKKKLDIPSTAFGTDGAGNEWFGGINGQIWKFDGKALTSFKSKQPIAEMITGLHADKYLWVGYRDKGIVKYSIANDSITKIAVYGASTGYQDMRIRCCTADKQGNLIWGTRTNGLFIFSAVSGAQIAHINMQNGLNANWIKDINYDTDGKLYLTTNNGINIISGNYKNASIKLIKIDDDHINRETNCITKAGDVFYVGTNGGVLKWMPGNIHKDTVSPPVYFTKITVQGLKNFSVEPYTANGGEISLPYDQHFISFEFAGISLKSPDNVLYHYILDGQDNEWSPLTDHNDVAYNLKPGNYTFKVAAENADGVWSRRPAVFHFLIRPPFWQTWWFIIVATAIIVFTAYSAYRYKLSKILALELLRNKISTDLHDDIGSTLSSISILSDIAAREKEQKSKRILAEISERSHLLMEKMDDIVWSISSRNDTVGNLFIRIQQFASTVLEAKDIDYEVIVAEKIKQMKLDMQQRQHIYLILKEAINNLIKYSCCTAVSIKAACTSGLLKIEVADNGKGFDIKTIHYGNGLNNMQKRADAMRGSLSIKSAPGNGTTVTLSVEIE
jgi:ligand-binding sensor domain-containing protein/two-component sensor histidine kinase